MRLSRQSLEVESAATGFRPEVLEKVFLLLDLLEAINQHPNTAGKFALKGGTALNLFLFDVPRLSVDIDLNYVGSENRSTMLQERPQLEKVIDQLARRLGLTPQTPRNEHAGMSWAFRYASALGQFDNVKVDINYMYRVPLWAPESRDSRQIGSRQIKDILLMDEYELAAGKLAALLSRRTSRDLFDSYELLVKRNLDREKLRQGFVLYGGMNIEDWRKIRIDDIDRAAEDLDTYLLPLLRTDIIDDLGLPHSAWGERLLSECREALSQIMPLRDSEEAFLSQLLAKGEIQPELFTSDVELGARARRHPALLWKAHNVKKHFNL